MAGLSRTVRSGLVVVLISLGVNGALVWWLHRQPSEPITLAQPTPAPTVTVAPTATPAPIVVHVSGAVAEPGVYEIAAGSRVATAIDAAGDFAPDAEAAAINLAAALHDGMQVHVPAEGEASPPPAGANAVVPDDTGGDSSDLVNINTAGLSDLETLPGIGPALAERIVEYRETNGPFSSLDAITNVTGIGDKSLEELRPHATVGQ